MDVLKFLLVIAECIGVYFVFSKILSFLATIINIPLCIISVYTGLIPWAASFYYIAVYLVEYAETAAAMYGVNELAFLIVSTVCVVLINLGGKLDTKNTTAIICIKILFPILSIVATYFMYSYKVTPLAQPVAAFLSGANFIFAIPFVGSIIHGGLGLAGVAFLFYYSFVVICGIVGLLSKKK